MVANFETNQAARGDYGIDAPTVVRNLLLGGAAALGLAAVIYFLVDSHPTGIMRSLFRTGLFAGPSWMATGLIMIYGSRVRKLQLAMRSSIWWSRPGPQLPVRDSELSD